CLESEDLLRRALRDDPKNPTALFLLGRALTARNEFEEAETVLKKSVQVSPNGFVAYMLLGSMYSRQNKFGKAEESLMRALKVVSLNEKKRLAQEFEAVGDGLLRFGKRKDAARVYRLAVNLDTEKEILAAKLAQALNS
ncbi:MAG TPA: tetratricopeptide repeat protein, partial [Pyrinomonadaceae bacterium]